MMHKSTSPGALGNHAEAADTTIPSAGVQSVYFPEKSWRDRFIVLGIFTVICVYSRLSYDCTNLDPDEGIILQGAQRILNGEVLYRDFFSYYTPGSYYWMAFLFRVFGDSILVARAAMIAYAAIFAVLTYLLARRVCSRGTALLTVFLLTVTCAPSVALHNWDSTLWALLALYSAVRFIEGPSCAWAFSVGSLTAIGCLFEQSRGGGLAVGLVLGFTILGLNGIFKPWADRRRLIFLALGLAWPFFLTLAYFGAHHSLSYMVADLSWPLRHYRALYRTSLWVSRPKLDRSP